MRIVSFSDSGFNEYWDAIYSNALVTPLYSDLCQDYYIQLSKDNNKKVHDKSFVIVQGDYPIIGFRGFLEEDENNKKNIGINGPLALCIYSKDKLTKNVIKNFIKHFEKIINIKSTHIKIRDFLINGQISILTRYLLFKGASTKIFFTQFINLEDDIVEIKKNIRKSYKSLINWGTKELQPIVLEGDDVDWKLLNDFRKLHIKQAGRETRSTESWKKQLALIKAKEAFLVLGHFKEKLVSGGIFIVNKKSCYYGVSASERNLFEKPLFHSLMWHAILHAKKIGCINFDIGEQILTNDPENLNSMKELSISEFKSGFSNTTITYVDIEIK